MSQPKSAALRKCIQDNQEGRKQSAGHRSAMAASLFSKQIQNNSNGIVSQITRLFSSKSISPYIVKVGIPEFLTGVGRGVESHIPKLEEEIGELHKLLVTRTLRLKKLGIPCKHRKLILNYAHKYRLGLWRPRADPAKP